MNQPQNDYRDNKGNRITSRNASFEGNKYQSRDYESASRARKSPPRNNAYENNNFSNYEGGYRNNRYNSQNSSVERSKYQPKSFQGERRKEGTAPERNSSSGRKNFNRDRGNSRYSSKSPNRTENNPRFLCDICSSAGHTKVFCPNIKCQKCNLQGFHVSSKECENQKKFFYPDKNAQENGEPRFEDITNMVTPVIKN